MLEGNEESPIRTRTPGSTINSIRDVTLPQLLLVGCNL